MYICYYVSDMCMHVVKLIVNCCWHKIVNCMSIVVFELLLLIVSSSCILLAACMLLHVRCMYVRGSCMLLHAYILFCC